MTQHWDLAQLHIATMQPSDLNEVVALELSVYPHPWSMANFVDSLNSNYEAWVVRDQDGALLGYFLLMAIVDEAHLLNVAVAAERQGQGLGRCLLKQVVACAQSLGMTSVLLEVRPSNLRALTIYQRFGFEQIGRRKAYYPAAHQQREDAIVMRLSV